MLTWFLASSVGKLLPAKAWALVLKLVAILLVLALLLWQWGKFIDRVEQRGYSKANAEWTARQLAANRKAAAEAESRDAAAESIAATTATQAQAATVEVRTDTAARVERVRTVVRTVEVAAGCPASLPVLAQDELQQMVKLANEANR